jgi:hypothetical protein
MKKTQIIILFGSLSLALQSQDFSRVDSPTVFDQTAYSARMAYLSEPSIGLEINNRFVKELNVLEFLGAFPFSSGTWSAMYKTYGYLSYREHGFAVGFSKAITSRWALGLRTSPKIETFGKGYDSRYSMDLNLTSFAKLSQDLYWDSELNFPTRISSNTRNDAPLQSFLKMGLSYVFSKQCQVMVSAKQLLSYKTEVDLQLCYSPISALSIFGNVDSSSECGLGVWYVLDQIMFRFQAQYRPIIGYSTTVGISYQFRKSERHDI